MRRAQTVIGFLVGLLLLAVEPVWCESATTGSARVVSMALRADSESSWRDTMIGPEEPTLRAEPPYKGSKVKRGILKLTDSPETWMAFAWDRSANRVYLDMNRDLDLTNDTTGVLRVTANGSRPASFNAEVPMTTAPGEMLYRIAAELDFGPACWLCVRGEWTGTLNAGGRDWLVGLQPRRLSATSETRVSLRLAGSDAAQGHVTSYMSLPSTCTLNSETFLVEKRNEGTTSDSPVLVFTPVSLPTGELRFSSPGISELHLRGIGGQLVILATTETIHRVPADEYQLGGLTMEPFGGPRNMGRSPAIVIAVGGSTTLPFGPPIRPMPVVNASGAYIDLSCRLVGAGGEEYGGSRQNPPKYGIFLGDRLLKSGVFEYG